jgi:hypothetical protein
MAFRHHLILTLAILLNSLGLFAFPVRGQVAAPHESTPSAADPQEAARRQILESDRWRNAGAKLNEWFSIQQIYSPDQVTAIKAELAAKIAKMPPQARWKRGSPSCRVLKPLMPECGYRGF